MMKSEKTTTEATMLHDRICLLFARLTCDPITAMALDQFDRETGIGDGTPVVRGEILEQLLDAAAEYERVTGGSKHPATAAEELEGLLV